MDWLDLLAIQGTLKSLLQHHNLKASVLQCSVFFMVQLSHPYMIIGKTIALAIWIFVGKVMSLLFNMLSRFFISFLPRRKLNRIKQNWLHNIITIMDKQGIEKFIKKIKQDYNVLYLESEIIGDFFPFFFFCFIFQISFLKPHALT